MPRLTKQKMLDKQTRDMVDIALEWQKLVPHLRITEEGKDIFKLFDSMQIEVLKTYTNIEEKISDQKD